MKRTMALLLLCLAAPLLFGAKRRAVGSGSLPGRDLVRSVVAGAIRHDFHVYVPSSYNGSKRMPLLLFFHGGGGNARQGEQTVNLRLTAERRGFILVRPEGYDAGGLDFRTWNAGACCSGAAGAGIDHVAAVRAILDRVENEWQIDTDRVFATGHSNGGMMSYRLACELSDRIAAIAPNSAYLVDKNLEASPPLTLFPCAPARPVPVMHMHGDADVCAPINGGWSAGLLVALRPPVAESIARFVALNRASPTARVTYQNDDVTCVTHDGEQNADVVLCTAAGGGHAWPGATYSLATGTTCAGTAIRGLDANTAIWDFFMEHPRTQRTQSSRAATKPP